LRAPCPPCLKRKLPSGHKIRRLSFMPA
jgi:hypothetical protein